MPSKRPKPQWGYRAKGMFEDINKEHYSHQQVSELAQLLAPGVCEDDLKEKLDIAANQYFYTRASYEDAPTHAESKEALKYLQNHAQKLLHGLRDLDGKSWNMILAPETQATRGLGVEDRVMTSLGYEIVGERQPDGSLKYEVLDPEDFTGAAEFIEFYISHALEDFPESRPGKMKLLSLGGWLRHMRPLWIELSGKKFTLDFHNGRGVSDASVFCTRAIDVIDTDVTDANLITAMRDNIRTT